jgi:hypothetical protein
MMKHTITFALVIVAIAAVVAGISIIELNQVASAQGPPSSFPGQGNGPPFLRDPQGSGPPSEFPGQGNGPPFLR